MDRSALKRGLAYHSDIEMTQPYRCHLDYGVSLGRAGPRGFERLVSLSRSWQPVFRRLPPCSTIHAM